MGGHTFDVVRRIAGWRSRGAPGSMAQVVQPSPLGAARHRAQTLASAGDLAGARAVLEHAVGVGQTRLGEDDPDVLLTACQLAEILQQIDDPSAARRVLEEAYAAGSRRLGDADPVLLRISHQLGVVAEELGNRHEARKAFARILEFGPPVLGAHHPTLAQARSYLGQDQIPPAVRPEAPAPLHSAPPQPTLFSPPPATLPQTSGVISPPGNPVPPDVTTRLQLDSVRPVNEPTVAHQIITPRHNPPMQTWSDQLSPTVPDPRQPVEVQPSYFGRPIETRSGPSFSAPGGQLPAHSVQGPATRGPVHTSDQSAPAYRAVPLNFVPEPDRQRRGMGLFAAIAAVLAAGIAVVALVFVLANRGTGQSQSRDSSVPTLAGKEPTDVRLRDEGSKIEISWHDPSAGTVSFVVTMGHPGELLKPLASLGPGQTSYQLGALNAKLNYCFTVVAVYRADQFATSVPTCTTRAGARPGPSTSA